MIDNASSQKNLHREEVYDYKNPNLPIVHHVESGYFTVMVGNSSCDEDVQTIRLHII